MIPLSIPNLTEKEAEMTSAVVTAGWISSAGPEVTRFGERVADYCRTLFGVPVINGTAALHLALQVAGVRSGDLVILPNFTFVATANAVSYLGASPVLVDISPLDWQMDYDLVEQWLQSECELREESCFHTSSGKRVRAIVPVHVLGRIGDMDRLLEIAEKWHLQVIEDAAEAMGSRRNGKHAGTFGDMGILSFNGNKIMSSGAGGMILTRIMGHANHAKHLSGQARKHPVEYLHDEVGYNYRLPNLNAALGLAQLERMEEFLTRKKEIDDFYRYALTGIDDIEFMPAVEDGHNPNHWMFCLLAGQARQLEEVLQVQQIDARKLWIPLNKLPMYSESILVGDEGHASRIYEKSLCLPCSTGISREELETVAQAICDFYGVSLSL